MPRVIHVFRQPERFVAGTVGEPGDRSFYLQAIQEARTVSVLLEKQQVSVLAERITALLQEVAPPVRLRRPRPARRRSDADPLAVPLEEEFRVGTMGLGWDADSRTIVVELLAVSEEEVDESVVLDDAEEGPDALRVFLSRSQARAFAERAREGRLGRPAAVPAVRRAARPRRPRLHPAQRLPPPVPRSRSDRPLPWICATPPSPSCCAHGRMEITGRLVDASNATLFGTLSADGVELRASTSPCAASGRCGTSRTARSPGARSPAYLVSEAAGWHVVPPTLLRDGPVRTRDGAGLGRHGRRARAVDVCPPTEVPPGWLGVLRARDGAASRRCSCTRTSRELRAMAVFDVVVNNADRKGGHVLAGVDGRIYGVDHGLCLHVEHKLRTVLWGWVGQPMTPEVLEPLRRLRAALDGGGSLATSWASTSPAARSARCGAGSRRC